MNLELSADLGIQHDPLYIKGPTGHRVKKALEIIQATGSQL
jgi:hypothetical protein